MRLIREVTEGIAAPVVPEEGWNVAHIAHHGIIVSCDGFSMKLDLEQLNVLFDIAENGDVGEVRDHEGKIVSVEVTPSSIILTRNGDDNYPTGIALDLDTLKEMGIEKQEGQEEASEEEPDEEEPETEPEEDPVDDDTIDSDDELKEGVKRAYRRVGKKIKRGFRVTSGWRKGRVVANIKNAYKPRPKAKTRLKLRIAAKKKRIIRLLKGRITRRKPASKRLRAMNARVK